MSSIQAHPEEGLLLRYLDGEAPARKMRQVKHHLEACWECRTAADELERTVAACVHYRKNVLAAHMPAPPAPWADLSREFDRIDAEAAAHSFSARLAGWLLPTGAMRWALSGAAMIALAAGLYYQFHETPSVEAAALLKRAVAAAEAHPARVRRIEVRTRTAKYTLHKEAMPAVAAMFAAARYDFDDPLSAKSFMDWRDTLPAKQDEVRTVADPVEPGKFCQEITTIAADGELARASLMLRTGDLEPVEGRFEFRNQDWVELTGFTEASATEGGTPATTRLEAPVRRAEPSRPAAVPSGSSASISDELRVLAALHEIGADLGDPVEVKLADGRVEVSGVGLPPARQREIENKLGGLPGVSVQFGTPETAQAIPQATAPDAAPVEAPKATRLQTRVEKQLGGRVEMERFSSQVMDWTEAAMSCAYALRALAQRFPASAEAGMAATDRQALDDLARDHAANFSARVDSLHRALAPVLVSLGGVAPAQARPATHSGWQPAAEDAVRAGRRVEMLLSQLFGMAPETAGAQNLPSDLLAAMAELQADLQECERGLR